MKLLFVNTPPAQCGVYQYGENLREVLAGSGLFKRVDAGRYGSVQELREGAEMLQPDFILYNWQELIGGWIGSAPFADLGKQVLVFHDLNARFEAFDAVLFSDPTMAPHGNWHPIGRPLNFVPLPKKRPAYTRTTIGVNGFLGAWSVLAVQQILAAFGVCHLRLHLPYSTFCDPQGILATGIGYQCLQLAAANGSTVEVSHEYLSWAGLVGWLWVNDLNCYVRDYAPWRGVSSITDAALVARKPVAVNRCAAFRHLHDCSPSICLEDRNLKDILATGLQPLQAKYEQFNPTRVSREIKQVLEKL